MTRLPLLLTGTTVGFLIALNAGAQTQFGDPIFIRGRQPGTLLSPGDFNGDAKVDLTYWEGNGASKLHLLYNEGNDNFNEYIFEVTTGEAVGLQVADLNEDGKDDVIILYQDGSLASYQSTGTEVTEIFVDNVGSAVYPSLTVTDYDGDTHVDLIYTGGDYGAWLYVGDGSGLFGDPEVLGDLSDLFGVIRRVDLDGDDDLDFLSAVPGDNLIKIFLNDNFSHTRSEIVTDHAVGSFDVFNVDDEFPDIAFTSGDSPGLTIYKNSGDGTFQDPEVLLEDIALRHLAHSDYDKDGRQDIAIGTITWPSVRILHNTDDGFEEQGPDGTRSNLNQGLVFADVDGDGFDDVIELYGPTLNIYGRTTGDFSIKRTEILSYATGYGSVVDMNNDNIPDLLSGEAGMMGAVAVHYGKGDFEYEEPVLTKPKSNVNPAQITPGDFNNDGFMDVLYVGTFHRKTGVDLEMGIMLSDKGKLQAPKIIANFPGGKIAVGDFDSDNNLDVLGDDFFMKGDGAGNFVKKTVTMPFTLPDAITKKVGDFNNDGLLDLLVTNGEKADIAFNSGDASIFSEFEEITLPDNIYDVAFAFIDGDDKLDYVTTDLLGQSFTIGLNNGGSTFTTKEVLIDGSDGAILTIAPAIFDLNSDGLRDVVIPYYSPEAGGVWTYLQTIDGDFELSEAKGSFDRPFPYANNIFVTNLNSDQHPDIITFGGGVTIYPAVGEPTVAPSNIIVSDITPTTVKISLTKGDGSGRVIVAKPLGSVDFVPLDGYEITGEDPVKVHAGDFTEVTLTGLLPDTEYFLVAYEYFVAPNYEIDYLADARAEILFTTADDEATGLEDISKQIKIYPNPAKNILSIDSSEEPHVSFTDVLGRRQLQATGKTIDVSHLSRGYYIVEVKTPTGTLRQRMILE